MILTLEYLTMVSMMGTVEVTIHGRTCDNEVQAWHNSGLGLAPSFTRWPLQLCKIDTAGFGVHQQDELTYINARQLPWQQKIHQISRRYANSRSWPADARWHRLGLGDLLQMALLQTWQWVCCGTSVGLWFSNLPSVIHRLPGMFGSMHSKWSWA